MRRPSPPVLSLHCALPVGVTSLLELAVSKLWVDILRSELVEVVMSSGGVGGDILGGDNGFNRVGGASGGNDHWWYCD